MSPTEMAIFSDGSRMFPQLSETNVLPSCTIQGDHPYPDFSVNPYLDQCAPECYEKRARSIPQTDGVPLSSKVIYNKELYEKAEKFVPDGIYE